MGRSTRVKWTVAVAAGVSLVALILVMSWLRPGVPRAVSILAGPENSRSHAWAKRYATYAEQHGVRGEVVVTAGSGEIFRRLLESDAPAVGFFQSGAEREIAVDGATGRVRSLGSLYYEPIWLFVRDDSEIRDLNDLRDKRVFIGAPGSDTRAALGTAIRIFGIADPDASDDLAHLSPSEAVDALLAGKIDAAGFVGESAESSISRLFASDAVRPLPARHAEVYSRVQPDVGNLLIPQGLFDLVRMIPRQDVRVIAPAINLVALEGVHPAVVDLFLDAATRFHSRRSLLSKRGEFPSEDYTSLPMNEDAVRYFKKGPGGLRKYLPFWLASLIDELMIYLVPLFVVLSSVFKGTPVVMELKVKFDLLKYYKRIGEIEQTPNQRDRRDELLRRLDAIDADSAQLRVPKIHLPTYFELRQYLHDMRDRIERL